MTIISIDPRRITDRLFGGPNFAAFDQITPTRIRCQKTGDIFDTRGINDAWMEGRNLAPIIKGNRKGGAK